MKISVKNSEKKAEAASGKPKRKRKAPEEKERDELRKIWTRSDALRGLKQVVNVSIEAARQEITDEDGEISEIKFNPSAANAATKAIEAANRLCGYDDEPSEKDEDDEIVICFEEGKEYAR
ncbi:MAG: hypothetical protein IJF74_03180 [Clostridia bacterium]|nr:hypothetical protein [Clostridia bacterium]